MTAYWLWQQYRSALLRRIAGYTDPRSLRVAADYLCGAPAGIGAWYAAVREGGDEAAPIAPLSPIAPHRGTGPRYARALSQAVTVSVIIPTVGRPDALGRCLAALPAPGPALEIIVVDDRPAGSPGGLVVGAMPPGVRTLRSGGSGAAGARNARRTGRDRGGARVPRRRPRPGPGADRPAPCRAHRGDGRLRRRLLAAATGAGHVGRPCRQPMVGGPLRGDGAPRAPLGHGPVERQRLAAPRALPRARRLLRAPRPPAARGLALRRHGTGGGRSRPLPAGRCGRP